MDDLAMRQALGARAMSEAEMAARQAQQAAGAVNDPEGWRRHGAGAQNAYRPALLPAPPEPARPVPWRRRMLAQLQHKD